MLKTLENEFKNCCLKLEHLQNQLDKTFNLKEKENFKNQIKNINKSINELLDEYNKGEENVC